MHQETWERITTKSKSKSQDQAEERNKGRKYDSHFVHLNNKLEAVFYTASGEHSPSTTELGYLVTRKTS